ncbi:MAG: hypothetical protein WAN36_13320, partial [Calditrichia bacterium]
MNFKIPILLLIGVVLFFAANMNAQESENQKHPDVDFSISCMECHQEVTPGIFQAWKQSKHGLMDFGCYMCHGDGQENFRVKPGSDICAGCHSAVAVDFSSVKADNCYDCHQGHSLKFHHTENNEG